MALVSTVVLAATGARALCLTTRAIPTARLAGGDDSTPNWATSTERARTVQALNDLFFRGGETTQKTSSMTIDAKTGAIANLPLWRSTWSALPGARERYDVSLPTETHMFEHLLRCPEEARFFGHLLGDQQTTGTLMELLKADRLPDGRLVVVAQGVGRFTTVSENTREMPYTVADAMLRVDEEERVVYGDDAIRAQLEWRPLEFSKTDISATISQITNPEDTENIPVFAPLALEDLRVKREMSRRCLMEPPVVTPPRPARRLRDDQQEVDATLAEIEMRVWSTLVRCCHLLVQCLKREGELSARDAALRLPRHLVALQPPGLADKLLVGADCVQIFDNDDLPFNYYPLDRRARRLSFAALHAVADDLAGRAAKFVTETGLGDDLRDRADNRQALLETTSTLERLQLTLRRLDTHASMLTAFLLM
eukprot:CAMPEP_0185703302 /NCGR_PEP_ID=MMETSP1164-20130828/14216_1 /TAXON_ID=1104430 /ORGANISM="Chrysoreinhardia sp, Strain CCMP2950" /LENGTH=424 /DNA_ID=CAMNT_0028370585 /DNA_START=6 /DNA_END=1280 /DNA_ORIENTATION=-